MPAITFHSCCLSGLSSGPGLGGSPVTWTGMSPLKLKWLAGHAQLQAKDSMNAGSLITGLKSSLGTRPIMLGVLT